MSLIKIALVKMFIQQKRRKFFKKIKLIGWVLIIAANLFQVNTPSSRITDADSKKIDTARQAKIEAYLEFKKQYEDKDFELKHLPMTRTMTLKGTSAVSQFTIYHIEYGSIAEHRDTYNRNCNRILKTPTRQKSAKTPQCDKPFYVERYTETGLDTAVSCFQPQAHSYPVALIFEYLADKELEHLDFINEFHSGELDIQFSFEKATDEEFMRKILIKLQDADEKNDQKAPPSPMTPIIPAEHQRISISYIDADKNDEAEFVLLPYCIDGSYFDEDPDNNVIQVGLKYPLVTKADLAFKTESDPPIWQNRLGLWKWNRPTEILISFCENPGPDIVFYDLGSVVNGRVVDPEPDGVFDQYEFLY